MEALRKPTVKEMMKSVEHEATLDYSLEPPTKPVETRTAWSSDESAFDSISEAIAGIAKTVKEHPEWGIIRVDTPELMAYFHVDRLGVYEFKDGALTLVGEL